VVLRRSIWLLFGFLGCIRPEPAPAPAAQHPVAAVLVLEDARGKPVAAPAILHEELVRALEHEGLQPRWSNEAVDLGRLGSTPARVRWLAARHSGASVMLIEARVRFFNEVEGRFRWDVDVKATAFDGARIDDAVTSAFDAPAILNFPHQGETDALSYAAVPIAREIAELGALFLEAR
jgi:hypothetical protein